MPLNLKKLLSTQKEFGDSIAYLPTAAEYILALNVEIAELINMLPWKWWKKHYEVQKEKTLEELADVIAFWLSYYNLFFASHHKTILLPTDMQIEREIEILEHAIAYGVAKELESKTKINLTYVRFEDQFTMVQTEVAGRHLGKLIGIVMRVTGASLDEVIEAYQAKMLVNWERQKKNY